MKFCSTKCSTRNRVRPYRVAHSNGEAPAHFRIRRSQLAKEMKRAQIVARAEIREATTQERKKLKEMNREIGRQERRDITASDALIAQEFERKMEQEFDAGTRHRNRSQ